MKKVLLPMLDGGIVDYSDDNEYIPGCETCDYGSQYITEIVVTLTKYKIRVNLNKMYNYAISEGDIMKTILTEYETIKAMAEENFADWFKNRLIELMKKRDRFIDMDKVMRTYYVEKMLKERGGKVR